MLCSELKVGAETPFRIVHITDTHLTYADSRDDERKNVLARARAQYFPQAEAVLQETCRIAGEHHAVIMHTGDLIDFVSAANLDRVRQFTDAHDCFMAAGNHEFSLYVGEAKEDAAYRNQSLDKVQAVFRNDIRMASRVIHGVNFVALDNGYYLFEKEQLDFVKAEVNKGLPIILMMHTPLFEQQLFDELMGAMGECTVEKPCAYLAGVPQEKMKAYSPERFEQQKADEVTLEAIAYFKSEPLIKAILAGHVHRTMDAKLTEKVPQIITSTTDIRLITVV